MPFIDCHTTLVLPPVVLESLELRRMFVGAINVVTVDFLPAAASEVIVIGDSAANRATVEIFPDSETRDDLVYFRIEGVDTQLFFNGVLQPSGVVLASRIKNIRLIDMGGGNDHLEVRNVTNFDATGPGGPPPAMTVNMGDGDDYLGLSNGRYDALSIDAGAGNDRVMLHGVVVNRGTSIFAGAGRDKITLENAPISAFTPDEQARNRLNKLFIQDNSGPLTLNMSQVLVRNQSIFSTGRGDDRLTIGDSCDFVRDVLIVTRAGDDIIDLTGSRFRAGLDIHAGTGTNTVTQP